MYTTLWVFAEALKEFDETVKVALDFARKNKNTLVIVTADHETGGLSVFYKMHLTEKVKS